MSLKRLVSLGVALLMVVSGTLPAGAQSPPTLAELSDVTVTTQPDTVTVLVKTSSTAKYRAALLESPNRLVVDFEDTVYRWRTKPLKVSTEPLTQVRGSQYKPGVARVVVDLTRKVGYMIREDADGLVLVIPTATIAAAETEKSKGPGATATPPSGTTQVAPATAVPQVVAQAPTAPPQAPPPAPPAPAEGPKLISLDFKDADVVNLLRILAAESTKNIVIGDDVKGKMSITLRNVPWDLAFDTILDSRGLVKVEKDGVIRVVTADQLAKERESVRRLEEAKLKAEAEVRQKIAEAALKEQEAAARKAAVDAAAAEAAARGPLREETIRLQYADPEDIAKTLQGILGLPAGGAPPPGTPGGPPPIPAPPFSQLFGPGQPPPPTPPSPTAEVLAKGITIQAHKPTNSLFIRHYAADLERIKTLIREKLDIPLPQVKIQARLDELNRTSLFEIGVMWGGAFAKGSGDKVLVGQGFNPPKADSGNTAITPGLLLDPSRNPAVNLSQLLPVNPATGLPSGPVSALTGLPQGGNIVNLPLTGGLSGASPAAAFAFGIIGTNYNINLALQALETQGKLRSLSRPEIATLENSKASIALGSEIPFATVSSAGTQIQFKEAVLRLEVTPTVVRETNATRIKMVVVVEDNSQGANVQVGTGAVAPSINKRRAETQVLVKEGDTLVIGGIMQRQENEQVRKVPLLGDIPVLGWLFKTKLREVNPDRELVVFITPTLVAREVAGTQTPPGR